MALNNKLSAVTNTNWLQGQANALPRVIDIRTINPLLLDSLVLDGWMQPTRIFFGTFECSWGITRRAEKRIAYALDKNKDCGQAK
jgi:hypothetical protein